MSDAVLAAILQVRDELRGLRRDFAANRSGRLSADDRELLARLLPAIGGARGSEPFVARDLAEEHPELAPIIGGLSNKALGRLLARAQGSQVDGYLVQRAGVEINVVLWRVVAAVR
ncbi:MAG: hypothetical protein WKH97_02990 [Casimicrobiaceae bacterium]